ncbi:uncharacterized protein LOC120359261 [Solenopsis invicta]|uniref:uncharacterized protein LOC120359261 n=1 Tax=Solenopsis invicta TaxID=13686 RepID=UPI00193CCF60|nr:uncharacterized protein LOC120359261 [Solenopsis invicta]
MIANCASPDFKTWDCYDVKIIKYCKSLESARKHASDTNYKTTDEESLGRGQRQHPPYNRFSSDEEQDHSKPQKYMKKKRFDTVDSKLPSCPENLELYKHKRTIKGTNNGHEDATSLQGILSI